MAEVKRIAADRLRATSTLAQSLKSESEAADKEARAHELALIAYRDGMTDVSAAMFEIKGLQDKITEAARLKSLLDSQKEAVTREKSNLDETKKAENPFADMVKSLEAALSSAEAEAGKVAEEVQVAQEAAVIANCAVKVFGPAGVRAYVLDTVTPYLNERTSHYLGTLSDGLIEAVWTTLAKNAKGELTEKFAIEVVKETGGKSFKALSGGQKRKVRLACALALQDLVASRASKPISLWIGDEIDDALDEAGLERLMVVLEEKAREKGTVLVISHNSLRDWIRETTVVTMEGGKSTVSGALC